MGNGGTKYVHLMDTATKGKACGEGQVRSGMLTLWWQAVTCPNCRKLIDSGKLR